MSESSKRDKDEQLAPGPVAPQGGILRSPGAGPVKAVTIAEPEESISPMMRGESKPMDDFDLDRPKKHRSARIASRLTGRASIERLPKSSRHSTTDATPDQGYESTSSTRRESINDHDGLISRVSAWINHEKSRRAAHKSRRRVAKGDPHSSAPPSGLDGASDSPERRTSDASDGAVALEQLQEILAGVNLSEKPTRRGNLCKRIKSAQKLRRLSGTAPSDTDVSEVDPIAPSCDAILDNSKTLSYSGGEVEMEDGLERRPSLLRVTSTLQKDAWNTFKYEIVRLTHTLRLKGWRRVPMGMSSQIGVERLSGALTNAVYVVSPPDELPAQATTDTADGTVSSHPRFPPPKLLLRIYGSNVDQLIDRESELQILSRLGRKKIGPRLLGTFTNGRFEEFFNARALTPKELRDASVSQQIAKRMRELHEGVELLSHERDDGPFVWLNIDKWMPRCEQIVSWLDKHIEAVDGSKNRPLVCGADWSLFRVTLEKYRTWLYKQYDGAENLKQQLVFAHNDTQYGNILRIIPDGESPLMLPQNAHKQLIVIDFEYANANLVGLEFANHFTEWCYNYHDVKAPYKCKTKYYPTVEEQQRFIRSYINHQPNFGTHSRHPSMPQTPSLPDTPGLNPTASSLSTSLISNFMLDNRAPKEASIEKQDEERDGAVEKEVARLIHESQIWRLANSAQWVMWGVMQAKIEGLPDFGDETQTASVAAGRLTTLPEESAMASDAIEPDERPAECKKVETAKEGDEDEDEEFDYLAYTFERAMFFWGDAVELGLVKLEELPADVQKNIKLVDG
ncbi:kinase-like protein [Venturia nashicola]|uniref:Kinase-like protein n=1 Tax=Venturia nashicola TaxID=86259 RepID=A0A4Z1NPQ3_9PEZI|nr:kinase-like protein [Venturia nashicola]